MTSPATQKTWVSATVLTTEFESPELQYLEMAYNIKVRWLAAGWTVARSCDGVNAATSTDQWTSAAALVHGNAGDPFSWIVFQSPAAFDTHTVYMLYALSAALAAAPPQMASIIGSSTAFTGGDQINAPTATAGTFQTTETHEIIPWLLPRYGALCSWHSNTGDFFFAIKTRGTTFGPSTGLLLRGPGGIADGGRGNRRATYFFNNSLNLAWSIGVLAYTQWRGWRANGDTLGGGVRGQSPTSFMNWTAGESSPRGTPMYPLYVLCQGDNVNASENRWLGTFTDVYCSYLGSSDGGGGKRYQEVRDGDTSAVRYVLFGALWLPTLAAQLPIP